MRRLLLRMDWANLKRDGSVREVERQERLISKRLGISAREQLVLDLSFHLRW